MNGGGDSGRLRDPARRDKVALRKIHIRRIIACGLASGGRRFHAKPQAVESGIYWRPSPNHAKSPARTSIQLTAVDQCAHRLVVKAEAFDSPVHQSPDSSARPVMSDLPSPLK